MRRIDTADDLLSVYEGGGAVLEILFQPHGCSVAVLKGHTLGFSRLPFRMVGFCKIWDVFAKAQSKHAVIL
jgi:hypothetical protein